MSSIKLSPVILVAILALAFSGCGDKNDKAVFSPESGHPSDWVGTHKITARTNIESCAECHGEDYAGGVSRISCMSASVSGFTCHVSSPAANLTGCVSCHGIGPFGTSAPNTKSAHTRHTALTGIGCGTCHLNAGSGTPEHAKADAAGGRKKATVAVSASFPFVYNSDSTCSNVSCHGGIVTPAWSGSINMAANDNSGCLKCHAQGSAPGTPKYNSYYSGLHTFHLTKTVTTGTASRPVACTDCHNIGTLSAYVLHFSGITTNTLTSPDKTIGGAPTKIGSYAVSTKTCSTVECHAFNADWIQ